MRATWFGAWAAAILSFLISVVVVVLYNTNWGAQDGTAVAWFEVFNLLLVIVMLGITRRWFGSRPK